MFRVPTLVGFFANDEPTKVGTLNAPQIQTEISLTY